MGITKDLVTGVWVGCDERTAHFKNGETGEGSRTALPIFAKFMEKVYKDPSTGYTMGPFPKAKVKITVDIDCPTPRYTVDTTSSDSLAIDSTEFEVPTLDEQQQGTNEEVQPQRTEENKPPEPARQPAKQPATEAPLSKKEERQLKRKQRQEEKEKNKNDQ
jgi:penicillin-binding protein 1A